MSIIRALCLLLVGATALAARESNPAQKPNAKTSDLCTVDGIVVKSTTGEGIKRVTVQLNPLSGGQQSYSAITENNGRFVIRDIAPGRYAIYASGNGYVEQAAENGKGSSQTRILNLSPGENTTGLAFRLVPPGVITGTVYDEDGEPVVSAQVRAMRVSGSGAHRPVGESGSEQTNDLGEYRIWGLQRGKYLVAATYQAPESGQPQPTDQVYLPTFHPSTPDASQATAVDVQPGSETSGVDVDLRQAHAVAVRGRVMVDAPLKTLRGVFVSVLPRTAEGNYSSSNYGSYGGSVQDDSGNFEIRGVPPGPYNVVAFWNDGRRQLGAKVPIDVSSANLDDVTVLLTNPITLAGRFRVEGRNQFDFTRLGLVLQSTDTTGGSDGARIKPDGTFIIPAVFDGNYRVRVYGFPAEYYVKSAQQGRTEVLLSGLTVSRSQPPSPLEITLSPDGGRVEGTVVRDQNPVGGALVVLVPDPPHRDNDQMYSMKTADGLGRFSLLGLPPGDFKLFAWESVPGTNYVDPDFFEAFEARATRVHIEEKQPQMMRLEAITADEQLH
jgi:protocatechuate 3,4-dioxygenase beta subunit